jgi:hypothetical protein
VAPSLCGEGLQQRCLGYGFLPSAIGDVGDTHRHIYGTVPPGHRTVTECMFGSRIAQNKRCNVSADFNRAEINFFTLCLVAEVNRVELAHQVIAWFAAGLAAGYASPLAGAAAAGAAPAVVAGMDYVSATGTRQSSELRL